MAITDPRDITGLVAWYSAEAETGYTDGAVVTQWTDLSGLGNHAAVTDSGMTWKASTAELASPCIRFAGQGYFTLPNVMSGATTGEIMAAIRPGGTSGTTNGSHWDFGGTSNTHFAYNDIIKENFGRSDATAGTLNASTIGLTNTAFSRWNVTAETGTGKYVHRRNGTVALAETISTVAFDSAPRLGTMFAPFTGDMACVVIYSRVLTTAERSDLDAWLVANPSGGTAAPAGVTVAGSVASVTITGHAGVPVAPVRVSGSVASVAVTGHAGVVALGGGPVTVSGSTASVLVAGQVGSVLLGGAGEVVVLGSAASVALVSHAGVVVLPVFVEGSDEFVNDGYNYTGTARVFYEPPIAEPPPSVVRTKVKRVHSSIPAPTLVNGRPTW